MMDPTEMASQPKTDSGVGIEALELQKHQDHDARLLQIAELSSIMVLRMVVANPGPGQATDRQQHTATESAEVDLPPTLDVVTAGRVLRMGRTKSYALAREGKFPCRVIHAGRSFLVPTAELLRLLGLAPESPANADPTDTENEEGP